MVRHFIKGIFTLFSAALLLAGSSVRADDTDIYFQPANTGAPPIVMFYIDYATNLNSAICTNVTWSNIATSCPQMANLQLYMAQRTSANPNSTDDVIDTNGTITQFAMTRAALKRVLITMGNMKVGIVEPHNNNSNCAGPSQTGCSNGAEIYERAAMLAPVSSTFNPLDPTQVANLLASDTNKAELFRKLDRMRSPQGYFSAPYQDKEAYYELFRYLAGKGVYNGHNGWTDFGTDNTYNLGAWNQVNNGGRYVCLSGSCTSSLSGGTYTDAPKQGNNYQGQYNGDFIVTSQQGVNPVTYLNSALFLWDANAESSGTYITPIDTNCQKIFFINIVDGSGQLANDSDTAINSDFSIVNPFVVQTNQPGTIQIAQWLYAEDLAGPLGSDGTAGDGGINNSNNRDGKQNVISYFVANHPTQVDPVALAGSGNMTHAFQLTQDPQGVINALNAIFNQVLSVSTTFVAASIPVNSFNRSTTLNNVFISLFQVNPAGLPQWYGNLKKLQLAIVPVTTTLSNGAQTTTNTLEFVDYNNLQAIASDGRIMQTAQTFWTNRQNYLGYDLFDNIDTSAQEVAGDDGRSVTRGGAGEQIPAFTTYPTLNSTTGHYEASPVIGYYNSQGLRQLYTNDDSGNMIALDNSNLSYLWPFLVDKTDPAWANMIQLSQVSSPSSFSTDWNLTYSTSSTWGGPGWNYTYSPWNLYDEVFRLMFFIRGSDAKDVNNNGNNIEARRWQMGDSLHSSPLTINYGSRTGYNSTNPDVRIILGSNDGFLRMIRNTKPDGTQSGEEVWAYMPHEMLRIQKTLMNNVGTTPATHPYGIDGAAEAYILDADKSGTIGDNAGDKAWIFFGMRRGGRSYYALDVTNPDAPRYMWKIDNNTPGFAELGYTFSNPVVANLDYGQGQMPVIIVGGGYDRNKDSTGLGTNDSMGNAVYIIDAATGHLVWKAVQSGTRTSNTYTNAAMVDSIPSDVSAYDSTGIGLIDRLYVGDTGGSVWRADLIGNNPGAWTMTKILNLGRHISSPTLADDRRFFSPPDVVPSRDASGNFDGVAIGSGDREHPLSITTTDFMYMYKDRAVAGAIPPTFTTLQQGDLTDVTYLNDCLLAGNCSPTPDLYNGWKLQMLQPGEKVLSLPLTLNGILYFPSYIPKTSGCGPNEGSGYQYEVSFKNATAVVNFYTLNDVGGTAVLGMQDRYRQLASGGIASGNYYLNYDPTCTGSQCSGSTGGGGGGSGGQVCSADMQCTKAGGFQQMTTYWYEKQK